MRTTHVSLRDHDAAGDVALSDYVCEGQGCYSTSAYVSQIYIYIDTKVWHLDVYSEGILKPTNVLPSI
jgi:hypothetical protein